MHLISILKETKAFARHRAAAESALLRTDAASSAGGVAPGHRHPSRPSPSPSPSPAHCAAPRAGRRLRNGCAARSNAYLRSKAPAATPTASAPATHHHVDEQHDKLAQHADDLAAAAPGCRTASQSITMGLVAMIGFMTSSRTRTCSGCSRYAVRSAIDANRTISPCVKGAGARSVKFGPTLSSCTTGTESFKLATARRARNSTC